MNGNYADKVNSQLAAENKSADFVAGGRSWGEHVNGAIVKNGNAYYLHAIEVDKIDHAVYENSCGAVVNYSDIAPFIPTYKGAVNQGVDKEVKVRDYKMSSIINIYINGVSICDDYDMM